jgi:putative thiamine transport system substrate-binding protein
MPRRIPSFAITRRALIAATTAASVGVGSQRAWAEVERRGRGQSVAWLAWAGDDRANAFIAWVGERMRMLHDVSVRHVRVADHAEAERAVSADLVCVDGAGLRAMREKGLLGGPVSPALPYAGLIDGCVPDAGIAVPWRMERLVLVVDRARVPQPPTSMAELLDWSIANPGRLILPTVRGCLGNAFLAEALRALAPDPANLRGVAADASYGPVTERFWAWYSALRPTLWRGGRECPADMAEPRRLLNAGEIDIMVSLNPSEAASGIAHRVLPESARAHVLDGGAARRCLFNTIPRTAMNPAGALLTANFLLSPEAQARAMDARLLGSPTVLALNRLKPSDRRLFTELPRPVGALSDAELGPPMPEPHPSWIARIATEWEKRIETGHAAMSSFRA